MNLKIRIAKEEVDRLMARAGDKLPEVMREAMDDATTLLQHEARRVVVIDTGALRQSISRKVEPFQGEVGPVAPRGAHGAYVEFGTRPHFPPVSALEGWARRHGMNPYLVARAISRRGTRPQPYLAPTVERYTNAVFSIFRSYLKKIFS
jgi:HK97 gp10 family phage protein